VKDLLEDYDRLLRREAPYFDPLVRLERDGPVVRLLGATAQSGDNCVLYAALDENTAASAVDRQVVYFSKLGRGFEWKHHGHDGPAELPRLLQERGFQAEEPETVMALPLEDAPVAPALAPGYAHKAWPGTEDLAPLFSVQKAVWPNSDLAWLNDSLRRERAAAKGKIRFHCVCFRGEPVCLGWTRLHGRFASLFGGSTLAEHRGRGLYRTLVAARLDEARRLGATYALVDAGPMSRPVLARLGFFALTETTPFLRKTTPLK
jgi:GNAT superfamily N-acetyltransferase